MEFISAKEAAEKWGITRRRVQILCEQDRLTGVFKVGNTWVIPADSEKPIDKRRHNCPSKQVIND